MRLAASRRRQIDGNQSYVTHSASSSEATRSLLVVIKIALEAGRNKMSFKRSFVCFLVFMALTTGISVSLADSGASQPKLSESNCLGTSKLCPSVTGVSRNTTSAGQITRFLDHLWTINAYPTSPLGEPGLQRCENPDADHFRVTCVFWPGSTDRDLRNLQSFFSQSKLFLTIKMNSAGA
jgi:hypothetical protein